MILNFLKSVIVIFLSDTPYRIKRFADLYRQPIGTAVDQPESLSAVLKHEPGEVCYYPDVQLSTGQQLVERRIQNAPRFKRSGLFKTPDRFIYSIANAGILGQMGLVYDPAERCFVDESAKDWTHDLREHPYTNAFKLPTSILLSGITLSFLTIGADGGFYHFLWESIVKINMYGPLMQQADHFLFNGPQTGWKTKWLNQAGVETSRIVWVSDPAHYLCEQLLFTNKLMGDQQINQWAVNSLKKMMLKGDEISLSPKKKILWISRSGAGSRDMIWESEILKAFPVVQSVDLSKLGAAETIEAFQQATHVVAPHGAGLSNLYLCTVSTKVLEIFPAQSPFQPVYSRLASVCGLHHQLLYLDFEDKTHQTLGFELLSATLSAFIC